MACALLVGIFEILWAMKEQSANVVEP